MNLSENITVVKLEIISPLNLLLSNQIVVDLFLKHDVILVNRAFSILQPTAACFPEMELA